MALMILIHYLDRGPKMNLETSGLVEITAKILKKENIEFSSYNLLKYLVPIVVDSQKLISLRNSSLLVICDVISKLEPENISECSALVYDLFSNIKWLRIV